MPDGNIAETINGVDAILGQRYIEQMFKGLPPNHLV